MLGIWRLITPQYFQNVKPASCRCLRTAPQGIGDSAARPREPGGDPGASRPSPANPRERRRERERAKGSEKEGEREQESPWPFSLCPTLPSVSLWAAINSGGQVGVQEVVGPPPVVAWGWGELMVGPIGRAQLRTRGPPAVTRHSFRNLPLCLAFPSGRAALFFFSVICVVVWPQG
ncbi:hypothetical protein GJAV_G00271020 [Gymnothorax javanicus]|nr:hypothetical protein GJAV_G00271020 [Gymnothorax javanicus]